MEFYFELALQIVSRRVAVASRRKRHKVDTDTCRGVHVRVRVRRIH